MKKLSIIIVNYNSGNYLIDCLNSIRKAYQKDQKQQIYQIAQIIVVDNSSNDNSIKKLKKKNKKLKATIIENSKNQGFTIANNIGVKQALKKKPDYVLFLNPDTVVYPKTLNKLILFAEKTTKLGIVTCRVELADGWLDEGCHRGFPTPWRAFCFFSGLSKLFPQSKLFSGYTLGHLLNNPRPHQIESCSGSFMLVKTPIGQKIGWWDEDYFFYGDDLDFCYRVKQKGFKIYFYPDAKITHYRGIASGIKKHSQKISKASTQTKMTATIASIQAMKIFYNKHLKDKYPFWVNWLVFAGVELLKNIRLWQLKNNQ